MREGGREGGREGERERMFRFWMYVHVWVHRISLITYAGEL